MEHGLADAGERGRMVARDAQPLPAQRHEVPQPRRDGAACCLCRQKHENESMLMLTGAVLQ